MISLVGNITGLEGAVEVDGDTGGATDAEDAVVGEGGVGDWD